MLRDVVKGIVNKKDDEDLDDNSDGDASDGEYLELQKSLQEKHVEVVEYLKKLPRECRATFVDVKRALSIDLEVESSVLDMLKNNPKVDIETNPEDNTLSFQFRAKYEIRNKQDLVNCINRVQTGILLSDILDCYEDIKTHCDELILSGDAIASKNAEKKTLILYPRGTPFYCELPGSLTAYPGSNNVTTSVNLQQDIRRGDAICLDGHWFRVSASIGQRSKAALSVTSDREPQTRHEYCDAFTDRILPLDGDFDGEDDVICGVDPEEAAAGDEHDDPDDGEESRPKALRHGVSNDIRQCWMNTAAKVTPFVENERGLFNELVRHNLLSKSAAVGGSHGKRSLQRTIDLRKEKAAQRKPRKQRLNTRTSHHNAHLIGTELSFLKNV